MCMVCQSSLCVHLFLLVMMIPIDYYSRGWNHQPVFVFLHPPPLFLYRSDCVMQLIVQMVPEVSFKIIGSWDIVNP